MQPRCARAGITLAALALVLAGCATHGERFAEIDHALGAHGPHTALERADSRFHSGDPVLDLLEEGMLLHLAGDPAASNERLEKAARRMDELDPFSFSEGVAAVTISEGLRGFVGEPYQRTAVHLVRAFNYIALEQWDEARVEALRIDLRLQALAGSTRFYRDDGFARYVAGLIFEQLGEHDDARIAYRRALNAYRDQEVVTGVAPPGALQNALLRQTANPDFADEHERLRADFGVAGEIPRAASGQGRVVLILGNGRAPRLHEAAVNAQNPHTGRLYRVAVPRHGRSRKPLTGAELQVGQGGAPADVAHDIDALSRRSLEERMPGIMARAAVRVAAKNEMVREAGDRDPFLGLFANIFTFASERADDRTWASLPGEYLVADFTVPAGEHSVRVDLRGRAGQRWQEEFGTVTVEPGRIRVLFAHSISTSVPFHRVVAGESS